MDLPALIENLKGLPSILIGAAVFIGLLLLIGITRLLAKQPSRLTAFTADAGRVQISRKAIQELIAQACLLDKWVEAARPQVQFSKSEITTQIELRLSTPDNLKETTERIQKRTAELLSKSLNFENIGSIQIIVSGFGQDLSDHNPTPKAIEIQATRVTPVADEDANSSHNQDTMPNSPIEKSPIKDEPSASKQNERFQKPGTYEDNLKALSETYFYGILDSGYVELDNWVPKFDSLVKGGAKTIQVRAKTQNSEERKELVRLVYERNLELAPKQQILLVINDDIDLCLEFPGTALHIGQDDTPVAEARKKLGANRIIGLSTHSVSQASNAMELPEGTIDYFAVGPVFATQTKPNYEPVGLELASWVASQKPELPFFCIGGINRTNANLVSETGAQRIVTVSDVLCDSDTARAVEQTIDLISKH